MTTVNAEHLSSAAVSGSSSDSTARASYAAFLTAQGRILHEGFLYNVNASKVWRERVGQWRSAPGAGTGGAREKWTVDDPAWFIEVAGESCRDLIRHLSRYKLRSKITLSEVASSRGRGVDGNSEEGVEGKWDVWVHWGNSNTTTSLSTGDTIYPTVDPTTLHVQDKRAPGLFTRYIVPYGLVSGGTPPLPPTLAPIVGVEHYHLRRYLQGVAEGPREIPSGKALPHEWNMDISGGGIDFHKGCYVGQEMTIRTEHRGVVRKRVVCLQLGPTEAPAQRYPPSLTYNPIYQGPAPPVGVEAVVIGDGGHHHHHHTPGQSEASDHSGAAAINTGERRRKEAGRWLGGVGNIGLALCRLESVFPSPPATGNETSEGSGRWGSEGFRLEWAEGGNTQCTGSEDGAAGSAQDSKTGVPVRAWMPGWHSAKQEETDGGK